MSDELEYVDMMRLTPAKYIYDRYHDIGHSYKKKPYGEYSEDYPMMEYTWSQDPIVIDWNPQWDWTLPDYDLELPEAETGGLETIIGTEYTATITGVPSTDTGIQAFIPAHPENLLWVLYNPDDALARRVFLIFDFSNHHDVTITSALLRLNGGNHTGSTGTVHAQQGTQELNMTASDFDKYTGPSFGSVEIPSSLASGQYVSLVLNASGLSYLNGISDGWAKFCIRMDGDINSGEDLEEAGFSSASLELTYV